MTGSAARSQSSSSFPPLIVWCIGIFAAAALFAPSALAAGVEDCVTQTCLLVRALDITNLKADPDDNAVTSFGFIAGGGLLGLAFILRLALEFRKMLTGGQASFADPVISIVVFGAVLLTYQLWVDDLIRSSLSFGNLDAGAIANDGVDVFKRRLAAFADNEARLKAGLPDPSSGVVARVENTLGLFQANLVQLQEMAILTFASISYAFSSAIVYALKIAQQVMLSVLRAAGPIVIGLSALPGPTSGLAGAWLLTLLEVGLWGFIAEIFRATINSGWGERTNNATPGAFGMFEDLIFNLVYTVAFVAVPVFASMLIRGGGAQSIGAAAAGFVTGRISAAGRALGAGGGGGGGGGGPPGGGGGGGGPNDPPPPGGGGGGGGGGGDAGGPSSVGDDRKQQRIQAIVRQRSIDKARNSSSSDDT